MTARVIVITDCKRFGSAVVVDRIGEILARVPRGSVAIQVREKDLEDAALLALTREILEVTRPHGAPVWINGRIEVALAAGATGVHLPENMSIADAKAEGLAIGCSRHSAAGVIEAANAGASIVQLGPIWSTPGKGPPLGVEALAVRNELAAQVTLVAVGGFDSADRAHQAARAGADAVAVIRAAWTGDDAPALIANMVDAVETAHARSLK